MHGNEDAKCDAYYEQFEHYTFLSSKVTEHTYTVTWGFDFLAESDQNTLKS